MRTPSSRTATLLLVLALAALGALAAAPAEAGPWAPAEEATITPGVQTSTDGAQCTANFVFTAGSAVYLGQAAHCASTSGSTATDGCEADSLPLGTPVDVQGASQPGVLAYSSWVTMQAVGEDDADVCAFNDFALVRLHPDDVASVNPSLPAYGGPHGTGGETSFGEAVYTYGNSGLRFGLTALSPKQGVSLGTAGGGWTHTVYTVTPGVPGDSGSAVVNGQGQAIGVLATLAIAPFPGSNGVTDLGRAVAYLERHTALDVTLADGTEPFAP